MATFIKAKLKKSYGLTNLPKDHHFKNHGNGTIMQCKKSLLHFIHSNNV